MLTLNELQKKIAAVVVAIASVAALLGLGDAPTQGDITVITDVLNRILEAGLAMLASLALARGTVWGILKRWFGYTEEV